MAHPIEREEHATQTINGIDSKHQISSLDALHDILECALCFKIFYDPVSLACGHTFCRSCLRRAFSIQMTCPLCRAVCYSDANDMATTFTVAKLVDSHFKEEAKIRQLEITEEDDEANIAQMPVFFIGEGSWFPGNRFNLLIFEKRYLLMMDRVMRANATFAIQATPHSEFGGIAKITHTERAPGGRVVISGHIESRYQVSERSTEEPETFGLHYIHLKAFQDEPLSSVITQNDTTSSRCRSDSGNDVSSSVLHRRVSSNHSNACPGVDHPDNTYGDNAHQSNDGGTIDDVTHDHEDRSCNSYTLSPMSPLRRAQRLCDEISSGLRRILSDIGPQGEHAIASRSGDMPHSATQLSFYASSILALPPAIKERCFVTTDTLERLRLVYAFLRLQDHSHDPNATKSLQGLSVPDPEILSIPIVQSRRSYPARAEDTDVLFSIAEKMDERRLQPLYFLTTNCLEYMSNASWGRRVDAALYKPTVWPSMLILFGILVALWIYRQDALE